MPHVMCCVPGCASRKGGTVPMYKMPRSLPLLRVWVSYLSHVRPEFSALPTNQLGGRKICKRHFEGRFFRNGVRVQQSCPTLFSIDEIDTGIPRKPVRLGLNSDHSYCVSSGDHSYAATYNPGANNGILHAFPNPEKEPDRFRDWTCKVGGDILNKENLYIYKYRKVCHLHFEDKYMTRSKMLSHNAVPTLKLSGGIIHVFPNLETFPKQLKAWCDLVPKNQWPPLNDFHSKRVCGRHFTDQDRNRNNRLNALAIPTLHLLDAAPETHSVCQRTPERLENEPENQNSPISMAENDPLEDSPPNTPHVEIMVDNKPIIISILDQRDDNKTEKHVPDVKPKSQLQKEMTTCRTCLQKCRPKYTISVFTIEKTSGRSYNHMMHSSTGIKAVENDELPTSLCRTCKQMVVRCYNFQLQAKRADSILQRKSRSNGGVAGVTDRHSQENTKRENETEFMDYEHCDNSDFEKADTDSKADVKVKLEEDQPSTVGGRNFSSAETLTHHSGRSREKSKPKLIPNQCRSCLKSFNNALALLQHIRKQHRNLITYTRPLRNMAKYATPYGSKAKKKIGEEKFKAVTSAAAASRSLQSAPWSRVSRTTLRAGAGVRRARDAARCNVCGEIFATADDLTNHCMGHGATEVIMCALCERVYLKYSQFKRHFTVHHPEMEVINQTENTETIIEIKDAAAMEQILQHVRLTSIGDLITASLSPSDEPREIDAFVHTCGLCGRILLSPEDVQLHNQTEHPDCARRCCYCGMHFRKMTYLSAHQNNCKNTPMKYECLPCGQRFFSESGLRKHAAKEHSVVCKEATSVEGETDADEKRRTCEMCGMGFHLSSSLRRHKNTSCFYGPRASFQCDHCLKVFKSRQYLKQHMAGCGSKQIVRPLLCSFCGKTFTRTAQLDNHVRTHTGEAPFICSVCQKGFKTEHELKYHQWRHNGSLPFKCEHCGKAFPRKPSLRRHMMMHTGERPHKCNLCEAAFIQKQCLTAHMKKHYDLSLDLNLEPFKKVEASDSPTAEGISPPGHWEEGVASSKRAGTGNMPVGSVSSSQKKSRSKKGNSNPLILYDSDD